MQNDKKSSNSNYRILREMASNRTRTDVISLDKDRYRENKIRKIDIIDIEEVRLSLQDPLKVEAHKIAGAISS